MKIMLATLVLNEMEWLPKLYEQHKDWPGLARWVFVEAADRAYADANPELVGPNWQSVDLTDVFISGLAGSDNRVTFVQHGLCGAGGDPAQGKCEARNRYMEVADEVAPDFVMILDADEFHTRAAQGEVNAAFAAARRAESFIFRQRHIWRSAPCAADPLFAREVVGGYWSVPHIRGWRWRPDLRYRGNHNWLMTSDGRGPLLRDQFQTDHVQCQHLGFASAGRAAKNRYYVQRGEGRGDGREMYVQCRAAWEAWQPGDAMPAGARVVDYIGDVPEVFR